MDKVIYQCGDLLVDPANRRLTRGGIEIPLETKAFAVLLVLLARANELVTRDELLDSVWGHRHLTPATLNRVMALLRRALDDEAEDPRLISTVHGAGYRFTGGVDRVALPRAEIRAHFGPPPIAQLPAKLEPLIGREGELARLRSMLSENRAVTIIGPGGMGKTQCALEVGRLCVSDFPDGVWFYDLSPFDRAPDWVMALAATLSVPTSGAQGLLPRAAASLAGRKALLLIDNCDRLAIEVGSIVFELLRSCPDLKILATSQQRLDFVGERLMWLPPLELPPSPAEAQGIPIEEIASTPAVALLLARARAAQPTTSLVRSNVSDIVEICRRLEGMPLALELAAAQFAALSPADVRERLGRHLSLLASDSAGREPRHQTMRALVEWSYGLLSGPEQRLLSWLAVFPQGWTIDAAEAFTDALKVDGTQLLQLHSGLVLKSLVVVDPTLSPTRYRLLESVREFALQLLRSRGEEADARRAHLNYFVQLAERSHREILDSRAYEWVWRLNQEHANLDAALTWAKSDGRDDESALRLAGSLMLYAKSGTLMWLGADWAERALNGVVPEPSHTYVRALLCSGVFKLYVQNPTIESHLTMVVTLAAQLGDRWAQCCASAYLALWDAHQGRLPQAQARAAVAARLAAEDDDDWLLSLAGWAKAWIALGAGDYHDALATLQPLQNLSFDPQQHQMIAIYLSLTHYTMGHWREAADASIIVVDASLRTRGLRSTAAAIEIAGYFARRTERPEASARLLGKAAEIRERYHSPLVSFWVVHNEEAKAWGRSRLGSDRFEALHRAGASARDEIVIDEARALLAGDELLVLP
ncbi:MAG TPA: winged helix-turn-helix domain-containing protein [Casimicrobiaceae bacterium]|nr:winged helix-turn-helix domain-containing protein [Casimicrobiaceae bacterium]